MEYLLLLAYLMSRSPLISTKHLCHISQDGAVVSALKEILFDKGAGVSVKVIWYNLLLSLMPCAMDHPSFVTRVSFLLSPRNFQPIVTS